MVRLKSQYCFGSGSQSLHFLQYWYLFKKAPGECHSLLKCPKAFFRVKLEFTKARSPAKGLTT
jgi:hypothetical protein